MAKRPSRQALGCRLHSQAPSWTTSAHKLFLAERCSPNCRSMNIGHQDASSRFGVKSTSTQLIEGTHPDHTFRTSEWLFKLAAFLKRRHPPFLSSKMHAQSHDGNDGRQP
ncbi:hypothetical protein M413DRAFT_32274 [Hebeloma cylindrosporum]|uniref:Uncharacterized protein n=1 Tax=Hebeloma cylindrosporum TaxID=76867 RepID=A0A0C3BUH5_HEBCY|nr:hypothetical protein M413DRAFT_32274 [Hebeloma cylindrosporum h7]